MSDTVDQRSLATGTVTALSGKWETITIREQGKG